MYDLLYALTSLLTEMLYVYGCEWNYRADFCMYGSVCKAAETDGAMVLHGNRQYFHNDKQPAMKAVYQALRDVRHFFFDFFFSFFLLL